MLRSYVTLVTEYFTKVQFSHIATRGPSWNFSLAENLKSLSLQDGPREWHYIPNSYPPHPRPLMEDNLKKILS